MGEPPSATLLEQRRSLCLTYIDLSIVLVPASQDLEYELHLPNAWVIEHTSLWSEE